MLLLLFACSAGEQASPIPPADSTSIPTVTTAAVEVTATTATFTPEPEATEVPATPTVLPDAEFDGQKAFTYLEQQMAFGPRWPGSQGHSEVGDYIVSTLNELGWMVEEQRFPYRDVEGRNIIGRANEGKGDVIILGAHYDTRAIADQTPGSDAPVPGAVDGASGVAVLLELARTLELDVIEHEIWLAFFDLEDNGNNGMPGFDWIVGSTYMAENLTVTPRAMVLVDMVGDADQQLYYEGMSHPELRAELWRIGMELGYGEQFIPEVGYTLIDDHIPFVEAGIPAVDIIDFNYDFWHTVEDTADKASPQSLTRVGRTLEVWLEERIENRSR
ncbi:MAG: M28 family peptidase [Chloroflexota bacterium]|nr:MAG: M28 family peptidase [Chloroflexota bacterium]